MRRRQNDVSRLRLDLGDGAALLGWRRLDRVQLGRHEGVDGGTGCDDSGCAARRCARWLCGWRSRLPALFTLLGWVGDDGLKLSLLSRYLRDIVN